MNAILLPFFFLLKHGGDKDNCVLTITSTTVDPEFPVQSQIISALSFDLIMIQILTVPIIK